MIDDVKFCCRPRRGDIICMSAMHAHGAIEFCWHSSSVVCCHTFPSQWLSMTQRGPREAAGCLINQSLSSMPEICGASQSSAIPPILTSHVCMQPYKYFLFFAKLIYASPKFAGKCMMQPVLGTEGAALLHCWWINARGNWSATRAATF